MSECKSSAKQRQSHHHYLHHIYKVKKKLLRILLPIGRELRVASSNQSFEHTRCYANLVTLYKESHIYKWLFLNKQNAFLDFLAKKVTFRSKYINEGFKHKFHE